MEKELLNLTPKRFLCPYCGKWHEWNQLDELGFFDSASCKAEFECSNVPYGCDRGNYKIYFSNDYCYYSTEAICTRANLDINGKIPISSIVEDFDKPIVTFDVNFTSNKDVGRYECRGCDCERNCNCVKLGDKGDKRHMTITFGFEFDPSDYNKITKAAHLKLKETELQERKTTLDIKEQSLKEREAAITAKEQALQQQELNKQQVQGNKEDTTMANNFNINMEFGPNKDNNIASTLMGIAVKNGKSWRIYDKKKKQITDIGDTQLGNLPIFILPTTKLSEGDLIRDAGEYYFVMKVKNGSTQTLCAKTGELKNIIPIKNVLGFSCYSKVIALSDSFNFSSDFDVEKLAIISALSSQPGENGKHNTSMNQLLPLILFKDKLGDDDDMMNMMLMSSMMATTTEDDQNASINQLLPLIFLKDKDGDDDDMTKMLLMSSMMDGNMEGTNNLVMSYLMLDTFMGKKKEEKTTQNTEQTFDPKTDQTSNQNHTE